MYEVGLWIPYDGSRFKECYDVRTKDGKEYKKCYPNADSFHPEEGKAIDERTVAFIRLLPDEELDDWECTGRERIERNFEDFPEQTRFYKVSDYAVTFEYGSIISSKGILCKPDVTEYFIIDIMEDRFNVTEAKGFVLDKEFLIRTGSNGMVLLAHKVMEKKNEYLNFITKISLQQQAARYSIGVKEEECSLSQISSTTTTKFKP